MTVFFLGVVTIDKMADKDANQSIIPLNISRGLTDKLVEKRKGVALELER